MNRIAYFQSGRDTHDGFWFVVVEGPGLYEVAKQPDYVGPWCKVHNQPPDPASKVLFWHDTDDNLPCEWVKHTGSCEDDCQDECAYPDQFSECSL